MNRFCFILTTVDGYGADKSITNLILKLKEKNFIIHVISRKEGRSTKILKKNKIKTLIWPFFINVSFLKKKSSINFIIKIKNKIASALNGISALFFSIRFNQYKYDFIHTNTIVSDFGYQLSLKYNSIDAWHLREIPEAFNIYFPHNYLKMNDKRLFYSNSIFVHNYYLDNYNISSKIVDNIFLKYNHKSYLKKKFDGKFIFCFIGRLSKDKDPITVARAFVRAFRNIQPNKYKPILEIYGEGELKDEIILIFKNAKMRDQLFLHGYKTNINDFIKNIDVGICSSELEAFGRVTIEYMLSSKLVIASNCGNHEFIIKNNKTGLLFPYKNYEKLSELMHLVYNDEKIYKDISHKGFLWSKKKFNSEKSVQKFLTPIRFNDK